MRVVIDNMDNHDVHSIRMTEHEIPYIEIETQGDEKDYLITCYDIGRCGENIIEFYDVLRDDHCWLIGSEEEMDEVMEIAECIYNAKGDKW